MKFGLLRCLVFAFACVVGTCGVSVLADDPAGCDVGKYFDGTECKNCPNYFFIQQTYSNYFFIHSDGNSEGVSSCAIRLSSLDSKCDVRETDVFYKYDETEGKYNLDTQNYNVVPKDNCYKLYESVNDISGIVDDHCSDECPIGKYADTSDKTCKSCPLAGTNADGKVGDGNDYPYEFVSGVNACRIRLKENNEMSFVYNNETGNYEFDTCPDNLYKLDWVDKADLDSVHCGECSVNEGYYTSEDGKKICYKCPLDGTNAAGHVGIDERFNFIKYDAGKGEGVGINSCAVKLDVSKDYCGNDSNVVYVYTCDDTCKYIRTISEIYQTVRSIIKLDLENDNMTDLFCELCPDGKYNVDNECVECGAGYYLGSLESLGSLGSLESLESSESMKQQIKKKHAYCNGDQCDDEMCSQCPAGYYCPGKTEDDDTSQKAIPCEKNKYSEGGAKECSSCAVGYSTAQSGPAGYYDGLCLDRKNGFGVVCISSQACKLLTMYSLSMQRENEQGEPNVVKFIFGNNVEIKSLNQSVVQSIENNN